MDVTVLCCERSIGLRLKRNCTTKNSNSLLNRFCGARMIPYIYASNLSSRYHIYFWSSELRYLDSKNTKGIIYIYFFLTL